MLLEEVDFSIFDFETTGLYPYSGDKICEIGLIKLSSGGRKKKFHSLINPERPVSYGAFLVNGLTEDLLKDAPKIEKVLPSFMEFIDGSTLVAYNAGFDLGFLASALGKDDYKLNDYKIIDVLKLARTLFPGISSYRLGNVASCLGMRPLREHRAMSDAEMTLKIFQKTLKLLMGKGVVNLEDIAEMHHKKAYAARKLPDYKIALINKAISERKNLNITYLSPWGNKVTRRVITPKTIQHGYYKSYCIAYCHMRKMERNFSLDSIINVSLAEKREKSG